MQKLFLVSAALVLSGTAVAQNPMPMPPFSNTFTASATRGFWFQAPTGFTITGIEVYNEANQPFQSCEIVGFGASPPPVWPSQLPGTSLFYDNATPTGTIVATGGVPCVPGEYYGILSCANDFQGSGTSYNSYGNATGGYTSSILSMPVVINRFLTQNGIGAAGPNLTYSTENGSIARCDVYIGTGSGNFAQKISFGEGCNEEYASFYESHSAFDLSGTSLLLTNTGSGYVGIPGTTPMSTPVAAPTAMGDDVVIQFPLGWTLPYPGGTTTDLWISSNGFLNLTTNAGSGCCSFNVATLLSNGPSFAAKWRDLNPSSGGTVTFDTDTTLQTATITFDMVPDFGSTTDLNSFQYHFDSAGTVELRFGTCAATAGGTGWSPGNANLNPGSIDISAAPVIITGANDVVPLSIDADNRPVLGTTINLTIDNIPAGASIAAHIYGLNGIMPGLDLTSIGMPGCFQHCSQDAVALTIAPAGTTAVNAFSIPSSTAYQGVLIYAQGAVYHPAGGHNALGALSSNGMEFVLDIN